MQNKIYNNNKNNNNNKKNRIKKSGFYKNFSEIKKVQKKLSIIKNKEITRMSYLNNIYKLYSEDLINMSNKDFWRRNYQVD